MPPRRSFWAWGNTDREPSPADYAAMAERIYRRYGAARPAPTPPTDADLNLRKPRILPHPLVAEFCATDDHDPAAHTYGRSFRDRIRGFKCDFPNPPDVIAYPRTEAEVVTTLDWVRQFQHCGDTLRGRQQRGGRGGAAGSRRRGHY